MSVKIRPMTYCEFESFLIWSIQHQCNYQSCSVVNLPAKPRILTDDDCSRITIYTSQKTEIAETLDQGYEKVSDEEEIKFINDQIIAKLQRMKGHMDESQINYFTVIP